MDDFFENLGKRLSDTVDEFGKKAGDVLDIQKIKNRIYTLNRANERDFTDIGRKVYEKFRDGEAADLDFAVICETIEKRNEEISECKLDIERIKGE